jgi:glycosyltransferase involved in cell wall biosynthesis
MVSVIIPCYNYRTYIGDCIKSCLLQGYDDIEVIVVDDCSTDGSAEVIDKVSDSRVLKVWLKKNEGYSHAKNVGIQASKGDWIIHIDADDMLTPRSIGNRMNVLAGFPGAEIIHGHALKVQGDMNYAWCCDNIYRLERHASKLHAQGFMIKRSVFERFGLYYEPLRSKGDKEMWYRLGIHEKSPLPKLVNKRRCHEDVAFYRRHPLAMHKMRVENKEYDRAVEAQFEARIKQLRTDGITRENTPWLA